MAPLRLRNVTGSAGQGCPSHRGNLLQEIKPGFITAHATEWMRRSWDGVDRLLRLRSKMMATARGGELPWPAVIAMDALRLSSRGPFPTQVRLARSDDKLDSTRTHQQVLYCVEASTSVSPQLRNHAAPCVRGKHQEPGM